MDERIYSLSAFRRGQAVEKVGHGRARLLPRRVGKEGAQELWGELQAGLVQPRSSSRGEPSRRGAVRRMTSHTVQFTEQQLSHVQRGRRRAVRTYHGGYDFRSAAGMHEKERAQHEE